MPQTPFWKNFIIKSMNVDRIENQLWDFKETFESKVININCE